MRQLIVIGLWNDGSDGCPLHNPQEFVDSRWDASLREALFHYLRTGSVAAQYMGYSSCRFDCGIDDSEMGSADLNDGVWVWPEGLSHYVARHEVRLPEEFVAHARANGFCAPVIEPGDDVISDISFWTDWCAANTNGDPEAQAVWRRTPNEIASAKERILEQLLEKHGGLSEKSCAWAGCENLALRGLAFCSSCAHEKMGHWP